MSSRISTPPAPAPASVPARAPWLTHFGLLTNSDMDSHSPFAGILLGQPMLNRQLRLGVFAAYVADAIMLRSTDSAVGVTVPNAT